MPVAVWQMSLAWAITAGTAALQGTIGFGFALVSVPLLSLIDPSLAPVPQLLLTVPVSLTVAWRERYAADLRGVKWVLVGRIPGALAGLALLAAFDQRSLSVAIGAMVIGAVAMVSSGVEVRRNPATSLAAGILSGTTGLVASIGGPPLALLYRSARGATIRASLGVVFAIGVMISIIARASTGRITADDLQVAGLLLPAVAGGLWIGRGWAGRLPEELLRSAILVVSAAAGVALLVRNLV